MVTTVVGVLLQREDILKGGQFKDLQHKLGPGMQLCRRHKILLFVFAGNNPYVSMRVKASTSKPFDVIVVGKLIFRFGVHN